jgi:hypothetical protein
MCIPLLFHSCQGQVLDIEKLSLPIKNDKLKDLKLSNSGVGIGTKEVQYTSYVSDNANMIYFGGVGIQKPSSSAESLVRFYTKNEGNSFQGYTLNIANSDSFEKVLAYLLKNKTSFKLVFDDGKDSEERARIFISNKDEVTYLLLSRLNSEGKKAGYIDGVSNDEEALLSSRLGGSFGYYEAFLEYKKHKSANLNYLDFLRETNNELYRKSNNLK